MSGFYKTGQGSPSVPPDLSPSKALDNTKEFLSDVSNQETAKSHWYDSDPSITMSRPDAASNLPPCDIVKCMFCSGHHCRASQSFKCPHIDHQFKPYDPIADALSRVPVKNPKHAR